ncbi:tetratricopeptide repeat protein [Paradesertivirga mongoliensis]|uniref:Tetratricopeptide repeat protein n=1 Tax=Paradesertivirga mongoliensis TaxID=2100740 RepID=A0ABW4ZK08_9SPHI|nr:tetratricopeptide repeat protein [Pedobacter mongoliensis]
MKYLEMKLIKKVVNAGLLIAVVGTTAAYGQNIAEVKMAIDAEQYQKAKTSLKALAASKPSAEVYFHLGNLYLADYPDSAKALYSKGVAADAKNSLSYIGLGAIDLRNNNAAAAKANFDKAIDEAGRRDNDPYIYIAKAYIAAPKPDYNTAITYLEKAIAMDAKDAEAQLALGDAYRGLDKNSEAFSAYRSAYELNKSLLRAKIELGVINKRAQAWQQSIDEFNAVLAINPNYAPAYRELAETYNNWATKSTDIKDFEAKNKQALDAYRKYMDLTDRSLESRMRYADFLILAKDYKTLESEAQEMAKIDKTNPRIYRYLGFAAFENGNFQESITAINTWMSKADKSRLHPHDYLYLGKAQIKQGNAAEGVKNLTTALDTTLYSKMEPSIAEVVKTGVAEQMSAIGKDLFSAKKYEDAAQVYELSLQAPKPLVADRFYVGYSHYFHYVNVPEAEKSQHKASLVRADSAFSNVSKVVPDYALAYLYRARVNRLLDDEKNPKGLAVPHFEKFITLQAATPVDKLTKNNKLDLVDAYYYVGYHSILSDPNKAKTYFNKVLELDPTHAGAQQSLRSLATN